MKLRTPHFWLSIALSLSFAGSLYCLAENALAYYVLRTSVSAAALAPSQTAEAVATRAAQFQENTPATNGLFRIVQDQHVELQQVTSLLGSFYDSSLTLAWSNTVYFAAVSVLLGVSLYFLRMVRLRARETKSP
jgi:hypothetical protein